MSPRQVNKREWFERIITEKNLFTVSTEEQKKQKEWFERTITEKDIATEKVISTEKNIATVRNRKKKTSAVLS